MRQPPHATQESASIHRVTLSTAVPSGDAAAGRQQQTLQLDPDFVLGALKAFAERRMFGIVGVVEVTSPGPDGDP